MRNSFIFNIYQIKDSKLIKKNIFHYYLALNSIKPVIVLLKILLRSQNYIILIFTYD